MRLQIRYFLYQLVGAILATSLMILIAHLIPGEFNPLVSVILGFVAAQIGMALGAMVHGISRRP